MARGAGRGSGIFLKSLQWFLRAVEFCCAAVVLAIFSYFLATLHNHDLTINNYIRSVEGLSGGAVLYTLLALLFLCCLGGFTFFAFLAILLDLLFVGAFVYIAYENRGGASSCNGNVNTPFGNGNTNTDNTITAPTGGVTLLPSLREACRLETACFAVSIVAIVFFLLSAIVEFAMWRHHKAEKKYGPSPANGYTAGSGRRRFWQRKPRTDATLAAGGLAAEKHHHDRHHDALPTHNTPADVRTSYQTDNTAVGPEPVAYNKYGHVGNAGVGDGYAAPGHGYPAPEPLGPGAGYQTSGVTGANEMPADTGYGHNTHTHTNTTTTGTNY